MSKGSGLFKDRDSINNITKLEENIDTIYNHINDDSSLRKLLFGTKKPTEREHHENHIRCSYKRETGKVAHTEKRMCRCMFYFNSNLEGQHRRCQNCSFDEKWVHKNDGFSIENYELPPSHVCTGIGGVDLILKKDKLYYSVEMKPKDSQETIARMIAEALTYNMDERFSGKYIPSIGFFENSEQQRQYNELIKNNENFKAIIRRKNIAVFEFSIDSEDLEKGEKTFSINKLN